MTPLRSTAVAGAIALLAACATGPNPATGVRAALAAPQTGDAYFRAGAARAAAAPSSARARNVIIFVGDGMGVTTVTAARIYAGQRAGRDGESNALTMDTFPHTAFSRTYSDDMQISESASTATAIVSGLKTKGGGLGLTAGARLNQCGDVAANVSRSLFALAEDAGLATGVVSTARITHATPASTYAHVPNRNWENDAIVKTDNGAPCPDIARQLVEWPAGDGFEIALGGGRANFLPNSVADPESPAAKGARLDGRNLIAEWSAKPRHAFVWNTAQLSAAPSDAQILGLFSPSHMAYESDRARDTGGEPSLKEMAVAAVKRLARDPDGYVLLVEGGRIDHGHHEGRAAEALSEAVAMDEAIRAVLEMTRRDDTLVIVTADHSHTLTMSGYARRGTPILGLSTTESGAPALAADNKPYTTLGYANGPGAVPAGQQRQDLSQVDTTAQGFHQQSAVPMMLETHGGEDVPLYAWGPGDENFAGTLEQNVIFHLAARALGFSFR
jgi:alkaline phosphatase